MLHIISVDQYAVITACKNGSLISGPRLCTVAERLEKDGIITTSNGDIGAISCRAALSSAYVSDTFIASSPVGR